MDEAFYATLGAHLNSTGTETFFSPSGFDLIPGLPEQTWYHWGDLWLAAAIIRVFGSEPMAARYFVVLPLLLLASSALTGTLVRQVTGATSRASFAFGFTGCLFLAPIPLISGPFFSQWAVGLIFGITMYGVAAMAAVLALSSGRLVFAGESNWPLIGFVGTVTALLVPAHIILGALAAIGVVGVAMVYVTQAVVTTQRLPLVSVAAGRFIAWAGATSAISAGWNIATGHGIGASGAADTIAAFNLVWLTSVASTVALGGAFLAILIASVEVRGRTYLSAICLGTVILLAVGACVWGARYGDHNMFHTYFGGIAAIATPVALVACWSIWLRLRETRRFLVAPLFLLMCIAQIEFGVATGILRLHGFGPGNYEAVPVTILEAIRSLPTDAKLAYGCRPAEEISFWEPRLLGISVHTARSMVPMCFEAEYLTSLSGVPISQAVMSPLFVRAPQRSLYPDAAANPTPSQVVEFLKSHGVDYRYADGFHPNTLVPGATVIASSGAFQILAIP